MNARAHGRGRTMRMWRRGWNHLGGLALAMAVLPLPLAIEACGGSNQAAKTAENSPESSATAAPPPATNAAGQQVGVVSGDDTLNGAAKDAYDKGFSAWVAGDLPAAKQAFNDAANRAPQSGGPKYSLGCVLERLGDTQGALDAYRSAYVANPKYDVAVGAYALLLARSGHGPDAEMLLGDKRTQNPDNVRYTAYLAEVRSIEGDSPGCQLLAQQALI